MMQHELVSKEETTEPETRAQRGAFGSRARGLLSPCIFSALLALIPLTALPYGMVDPMWEGLFECAVFSLAALWALDGALGGSWFEGPYDLLVPLPALAAYMLLQTVPVPWAAAAGAAGVATSATLSADPHATRLVLAHLLALIVAAWLLHKYTSSSRRARALAYTVICVCVASAVFGMLRQTTGRNVLEALLPRLGAGGGYAQFVNRNHFAFLMEMGLGLALGIAVGQRDRRELVPAYLAPALPMAAGLVLSNSRGGVVALLCQILFLTVCAGATRLRSARGADERYPRGRTKQYALRAALIAGLLLASVVGIVWVGGDPLADHVQSASGDFGGGSGDRAGASRLQIWRASWRLFEDSPLVGAGFGAYPLAVTKYHEASGRMAVRQAHNDYLELLASGGLVGAGLVAWFFALLVKRARSALRTPAHFRRSACLGALTGLVGVAVHSVFDFGLHVGVNALCAVVLIVLATPTAPGHGRRERGNLLARPARSTAGSLAVLLCLAVILWAGTWAFRAAVARTFADYALSSGRVIDESGSAESLMLPADEAVKYSPGDAAGHFARAVILAYMGRAGESADAARAALALRPRDFALWLRYGQSLEEAGDAARAELAFREAVRLAPHYARPAWQLGNMLLRAGSRDEAFVELRRAALSDPALYPIFMQTLWHATDKDAASFGRAARPETPEQTLAVVTFLVKSGAAGEGLEALRESGAKLTPEARRSLVSELVSAESFNEAYGIWSEGRGPAAGLFDDGGFEAEAHADEDFGWRFARDSQSVRLSLDSDSPREGSRSLKVEYAGVSDPNAPAVSQLVHVEPGALYRLTFSARTKDLVTGGPPFVEVVSASKGGGALATLPTLSPAMSEWQDFSIEFTAPVGGAARVALKRQPCASSPCPAFGSVWLDAFKLQEARVERRQ